MGSAVATVGRPAAPVTAEAEADHARQRYRRTAWWAGAASLIVQLWLQLDLLDQRVFSNFYDIQARALLDGHLDVPAGALGNEAFAVRGQEFLYNPPGPSLLRLPVFLVTDRFDGRLTTLSMLAAWVVTVVLVALLVWRVRTLLRPGADLPRWEAVGLGAFLVAATVGTTTLYLSSIPWVFHEAYAWAIAMTIGVAHALLGLLQRPSMRGALAVGGFTLGAVLSRATAGVACGAAVVAAGAWLLWRAPGGDDRRLGWVTVAAGAVPVLAGAAVNWAKFRHPWLFPIEDQVFTGLSQSRRDAMAANGGDLFGLDLIRSTLPAYLRPDGIRFTGLFPFITLPADPAPAYGGNAFDLTYRTGSITAFMPLLVVLSVLGSVRALRRGGGHAGTALRFALGGLVLIPAGVLFAGYVAHRYTSEFVPFLVVAGAVGAVDLAERLEVTTVQWRRLALGVAGLLAAFGVAANLAVAVSTQALANPGPVLAAHVDRQATLSSGAFADHVTAVTQLPESAPADEVVIVGTCQAVFVGTGERTTPWTELGTRPLHLVFTRSANPPVLDEGALELAHFEGHRRAGVLLERDGARYRLAVRGGGYDDASDWVALRPGEPLAVEVRTGRTDDHVIVLRVGDGEASSELRVPKEDRDEDWYWRPNVLVPLPMTPQALAGEGVLLEVVPTEAPGGCDDWLAEHRERQAEG